MTTLPKLTFGPRLVAGDPITYDILIDGSKVGELKRYADADGFCTDAGLEELGLTTSERTAEKAKRDIARDWKAFNDSERLLVIAYGRKLRKADAGKPPAPEAPKAVKAKAKPKAPKAKAAKPKAPAASEAPATGNIPETWATDEATMWKCKTDGLNDLHYRTERKNRFYHHRPKGHPRKTLGSAKPGAPNFITLAEARALAAERSTELAGD